MIHAPTLLRRGDTVQVSNVSRLATAHVRQPGDTGIVADVENYRNEHVVLVRFTTENKGNLGREELFYPEELDLLT